MREQYASSQQASAADAQPRKSPPSAGSFRLRQGLAVTPDPIGRMDVREMNRRLAAIAALICAGALAAGCGGGNDRATTASTGPAPPPVPVGKLGELQRRLERSRYSVEVLPPTRLPRRVIEEPPAVRRRKGLPQMASPESGLRTRLPGGASGLVYRYSSMEVALAIEPSFLGSMWGERGVSGCERTVYFSRGGTRKRSVVQARDQWAHDVSAALRRIGECSRAFAVIA